MASNVVSDNFETGTGGVPQLGGADRQNQWCKAWVNFDGRTGGTVTIRDSYNISSIADTAAGEYTVNFATALSNNNYCAVSGADTRTSWGQDWTSQLSTQEFTTSSLKLNFDRYQMGYYTDANTLDHPTVTCAVFSN